MIKSFFLCVWRYGRWVLLTILVLYITLVIYRIPAVGEKERSDEAVAFIYAQTLTMEDVTGERLPPVPDQALNDSTIEGIDANNNGIRDDVEIAIFDKYSNDIKVRAAMLQYAMGFQMELTKVFSTDTWIAATQRSGRGYSCIYDSVEENNLIFTLDRSDEINALVINTDKRRKKYNDLNRFGASHSLLDGEDCDILIQ